MNNTPQFEHDCPRCIFLGRHYGPDSLTTGPWASKDQTPIHGDLYYCPPRGSLSFREHGELVVRFSSDGPNYRSRQAVYDRRKTNLWEENSTHINEARKLAAKATHIPPLTDYHPSDFLTEESNEDIFYHTQGLAQAPLLESGKDDYLITTLQERFDIDKVEATQAIADWRATSRSKASSRDWGTPK